MNGVLKQLRRLVRDRVIGFILIRSSLPITLSAFVYELGEELKRGMK